MKTITQQILDLKGNEELELDGYTYKIKMDNGFKFLEEKKGSRGKWHKTALSAVLRRSNDRED